MKWHRTLTRLTVLSFVGLLGAASVASAQDANLHKGKPTVGKVTSLADNSINLQTDEGQVTVTLQDKTTFERGDEPAAPQEIRQGDRLTVFGTKLPTGELVAQEVLLPPLHAKHESSEYPTLRQTKNH